MGFERKPLERGRRVGFAEVEVGVVHHSDGYEVEADEVKQMSAMWDPFDFHLDDETAEASLFAGASASGIHTLGHLQSPGSLHRPGVRHPRPVGSGVPVALPAKLGDTLVLTQEIAEARPSSSRPGHGIVTWKNTVTNQDGEVVLEQRAATLLGPGTWRDTRCPGTGPSSRSAGWSVPLGVLMNGTSGTGGRAGLPGGPVARVRR